MIKNCAFDIVPRQINMFSMFKGNPKNAVGALPILAVAAASMLIFGVAQSVSAGGSKPRTGLRNIGEA